MAQLEKAKVQATDPNVRVMGIILGEDLKDRTVDGKKLNMRVATHLFVPEVHTYSGSQWPAIDYEPIQRMLSKHDNFRVIGWAHTCATLPAVVTPEDHVFHGHMPMLEKDIVAATVDAQQLLSVAEIVRY